MGAHGHRMVDLKTRKEASKYAADSIASAITQAITARGQATIMLSGGSTPCEAYNLLSGYDLPWERVRIGLVDDRCVPETDTGSNQAMIRRKLLQNNAGKAAFIGLISITGGACDPIDVIRNRMDALTQNIDLSLMGLGTDGHTASWFPGSKGLDAALDINGAQSTVKIDAAGCAVAGEYPERITLTLPAIMRSKQILLFMTGQEKADVFRTLNTKSVQDSPAKALLAAGPRLTTVWAP